MTERNTNAEIYRVLMILGICMLHAIESSGHDIDCIKNPLRICVNGFVFISGWYGINFRWSKVVRLLAVSLIAGITSLLFLRAIGNAPPIYSLKQILYLTLGQWYLLSYIVLMLCAPLLNFLVDHADDTEVKIIWMPLMAIVLWNWLSTAPIVFCYLTFPAGFGAFTPLSLMVAYVMARFARKWQMDRKLTTGKLYLGLFVGFILMTFFWRLRLWSYNAPTATVFAGLIFLALLRAPRFRFAGKIALLITPSVFSVYLLHSHAFAFRAIERLGMVLHDGCCMQWGTVYLCLWVIFIVCLLLDMPRRIAGWGLKSQLQHLYDWIDRR